MADPPSLCLEDPRIPRLGSRGWDCGLYYEPLTAISVAGVPLAQLPETLGWDQGQWGHRASLGFPLVLPTLGREASLPFWLPQLWVDPTGKGLPPSVNRSRKAGMGPFPF